MFFFLVLQSFQAKFWNNEYLIWKVYFHRSFHMLLHVICLQSRFLFIFWQWYCNCHQSHDLPEMAGNRGEPLYWSHVCTSEAIHRDRWLSNTLSPCLPTFHHPPVSLPPLQGEATPVSFCCGSLSIQSKCCCYFLPVTPICQGPAKAIPPAPCPQWSLL